ncbi:MAG: hypothetical protein CL678_03130 [Bdellovibrionaceae bacterium]|nr:hypothetical protein [Pseudobdellovibrionaceae bacterium]|tara:strand:+ start:9886 stop:10308 length:423 start_codon:yes stop_codon:yes gene_type:complete
MKWFYSFVGLFILSHSHAMNLKLCEGVLHCAETNPMYFYMVNDGYGYELYSNDDEGLIYVREIDGEILDSNQLVDLFKKRELQIKRIRALISINKNEIEKYRSKTLQPLSDTAIASEVFDLKLKNTMILFQEKLREKSYD